MDFSNNLNGKKIFWLIPLQLLWVNMHVFFSIGIMLVAAFICEKIIQNYKNILNNFIGTIKNNHVVKKLAIVFFGVIIVFAILFGITK